MQDTLLPTIETFYDCVDDDFDYQRAINSLSRATDDTGFMFSASWPLLGNRPPLGYVNIPDGTINALVKGGFNNESHELFKNFFLIPELVPVLRRTYLSDQEHFKTRAYQETVKPWGLHSEGVSILRKNLSDGLACWFIRHPRQPEIDHDLLCRIAILNKHLARATGLQSRIDKVSEAVIRSNSALDLVDFGLVLYNNKNVPIFLNKLAQKICNTKDGISLTKDGISLDDFTANEELDTIFRKVTHRKMPSDARAGGVIRVPRPSGKQAYSIMVTPLLKKLNNELNNTTSALLIFDPSFKKSSALKLFTSSYGLTNAETRLAVELIQGRSLEEFAIKKQISIATARTQLSSIFAKTETSRQPELISLLLRSASGIHLD
ncbi:helix-turn-helix transcriptional regulator [Lentilitoribacter sp. Alg239-R112]|uniref:helix-turn-helix transcriptional regulator n=1 Tax=Lentilitoribacter sp. Alg239-R112 TaxID=2305987 RepID=UPI0013A6C44C|nr:helix-turn-helix transcriptional regulator [Lentilitoribacter sp. Alg239-R112]